jgi:hypothetical protein
MAKKSAVAANTRSTRKAISKNAAVAAVSSKAKTLAVQPPAVGGKK